MKVVLIIASILLILFFTVLILLGVYTLIDSLIEDITGLSLSYRIRERLENKNE